MSRNNRADVIEAAGRLFAARGYHGTSMRDLGRELGMLGSSLYSHVDGKQDLLVEVVERGAGLFQASADVALLAPGMAADRLRALIAGHIGVVLDHIDEVRTFLYEADALDEEHRLRVIDARDRYEAAFRAVIAEGAADGSMRPVDPVLASIFILSILNAVERWYRERGRLDRQQLVDAVGSFVGEGIGLSGQ
ncbi:MAG: TetR/AcrR family transcriptional regulator [Actinobacteria bacterium]|nr:MAG: TetR/AcrR family transcriptional regulator [Actinomycetota bacterium]